MQRYLITITLLALLALSGCRAASYFSQGNEHYDLGRYEEAIADYDEAIRLRPDYVKAYNYRGAVYADHSRYEEAIANFDEATRLRPDLPEAYFIRGVTHHTLGQYAKAITDLETALELAQTTGNDDLAAKIGKTLEAVRNP